MKLKVFAAFFGVSIVAATSSNSFAQCFSYDITREDLSNSDHRAFREILLMPEFSSCTNSELQKLSEGLKSYSKSAGENVFSGSTQTRILFATYLAISKASLALVQNEQAKRK